MDNENVKKTETKNEFNPEAGAKVFVMIDNKPTEVYVTAKNKMDRYNPESEKTTTHLEYRVQGIDRIITNVNEMFPSRDALLKSL